MTWRPRADLAILLLALGVVAAIRIQLLSGTDFPINDGALFLAFIEAIVPVFPGLPSTVEFSGLSIPFAYPPLSFWLAAAAVRIGFDPLAIVHRAPILMNVAYVLLFALVLLRSGHSRLFAALAVFLFGTTFLSYEWLVMGGGLSRGMGSLSLMATLLVLLPVAGREAQPWDVRRWIVGGVCVGVAVLSHLEWGILSAFSALLCLVVARPSPTVFVRAALVVGLTAAAIVAPWFWSVFEVHGIEPFVAAARTGSLQRLDAAPGGIGKVAWAFNVLLPFVVLGGIAALRTRDVFWLVFLAAALILTPRGGRTPALLALGVLSAGGVLYFLALLKKWTGGRHRRVLAGASLAICALVAIRTVPALKPDARFVVLPREVREAMNWVATMHPGHRFAVLNDTAWYYNASAEWFPVLARAVNTTTIQGREWLPDHDFRRTELAVQALNTSSSCDQLLRSLGAFARADFIWAEAVDLQARAGERGTGAQPKRDSAAGALHGPGTLAGCFDLAGYQEVHSNARVRIFRAPANPRR